MRVALTKGTLRIPPTYFAVEHALALPEIDWHFFTLAAQVNIDFALKIAEATPARASFPLKEKLKYLALARMRRQIESANPDMIHQHATTWSLPAQNAAKNLDIPLVTTIHGTDLFTVDYQGKSPLPLWNKHNTATAIKNSARIVAVSNYLAEQARARGVSDSKLEVIYQGVDTNFFRPLETSKPAKELREFIFVGALNDQKGILDLVSASLELYSNAPHTLKVIGAGPYASFLVEQAKHHPHIRPLGSMPRENIRTHLQHADALVLPTKTWQGRQEAAGLVLLEAQACGIPVITNSVGGTPEMVAPGLGWFTDENDSSSILRAMSEVISLPDSELQEISEKARAWVVQERSANNGADKLARLYKGLLG
ncbi:MAG: glycosyltransferase [Actinomycetaceae bacterium]|nr:glycosyltransferase [Actinomycetaceae bacterium]